MKTFNRKNLNIIWDMRNLPVKDFLCELSKHPDLKFLLTVAGCWWLMRVVLAITIFANVIYYVLRIFQLVLF